MFFRQFLDPETSTYTYLLADEATRRALLIDPVLEQAERDLLLLRELGLTLVHVLDTHVHADHITAASVLRTATGARTVAGRRGADCVDVKVDAGDVVRVDSVALRVLSTPGHTDDSVSFLLVDAETGQIPGDRVFTGDALLVRAAGRTDFQNGDAGTLYDSITQTLFALKDDTLVFPAHDYRGRTVTTIGEERRWNARLAGRTRAEFIVVMDGLHLPDPARLQEAVPANRSCGRVVGPTQG